MNGTAKVIKATNKEIRPEYLQTSLMMKHGKDNKILGLNFLIKVIDFIFILYLQYFIFIISLKLLYTLHIHFGTNTKLR